MIFIKIHYGSAVLRDQDSVKLLLWVSSSKAVHEIEG